MVENRGRDIIRTFLHFDGAPDLVTRMRALFETTSRLQVRYPTPDPERHRLRGTAAAKEYATSAAPAVSSASAADIVWG